MRYDKVVTFHNKKGASIYNPDTGEYGDGETTQQMYANVTSLGTVREMQLFGSLDGKHKAVRIRYMQPLEDWDYLTIAGEDGTKYQLATKIHVLKGYALIVGEDHGA